MNKLLLRVPEVAEALGISRAKAYEEIAAGEIPSVLIGGCIRVPLAALEAWIKERTALRACGTTEGTGVNAPSSAPVQ